MKSSYLLFAFLLLGGLFIACKKSDIEYNSDFRKSQQSWANFKASSGNSYRYVVASGSWVGTASETTITVRSGKVTQRSYILKGRDQTNALVVLTEWQEDENSLNSHSGGAASLTLDEVYAKAQSEWLIKRSDATTYFEANNAGMISSCGYVENNCADDCFIGISITSIEKL